MFTKTLTFFTLLLSLTLCSHHHHHGHNRHKEIKPLFDTWKVIHKRDYHEAEELARLAIFFENYQKIADFNAKSTNIKLGLNKFADLTAEEFKNKHSRGLLYDKKQVENNEKNRLAEGLLRINYDLVNLPESIDWREKGAVTPVKHQKDCGSCWSFASTGALEALHFIKTGKLLTFSEQQLVDCDKSDKGCDGGLPSRAFAYTAEAGVVTEENYPYKAEVGECSLKSGQAFKVNTGSRTITPKSVKALKAALVKQPVTIGIEADQEIFQFYKSGVLKSEECGDDLDHAVLAVGYTKLNGEEAFIVKNSWGEGWGDNGYVYISTNEKVNNGNGVCGVLGLPVAPTA